MNRRGFLKFVAAALPAATLSAEMLEYLAPRPTIFLPPRVRYTGTFGSIDPAGIDDDGCITLWASREDGALELLEIMRTTYRNFAPQIVASVSNESPLLQALIRNANQRR